ncbi:MAG: EamA family transporter [Azospirillum sp.]|nr:EamA family transporter [Azospirillum sp.]
MSASDPPPAPDAVPDAHAALRVQQGIIWAVAAVFLFALLNVLVKVLASTYTVGQIAFFRNLFALIPAAVMVAVGGGLPLLRTAHPWSHLWRGAIGVTAMFLLFWSFALLPLADATALSFSAPLFLTALAVPLLGEKVGVYRWGAVIVGFFGVLIMAAPGGGLIHAGALVALASAVAYSLAMISIRKLIQTEHPSTIVFYFSVVSTVLTGLVLPFVWVTPTWSDFALMVLSGVVGGIAQQCVTRAQGLGPASVIGPFNYTALIWAALFGWLLWGEVPGLRVLGGAALVVASGLFILHRETRRRIAVVKAAPAVTPAAGE